ncbi:MAG: peptidoglycan DD-metalloendopeptidase family protein [Candidatus Moraniibacteriota bacterium]
MCRVRMVLCFALGIFLANMPQVVIAAYGADVPDYRQNGWASPVDFRSHEYCAQFSDYNGDPVGYDGHVGNDLCRPANTTSIVAIADGCVEDYSLTAKDYGGVGITGGVILLQHYTDEGEVFFTVYGHDTPDTAYLDARKCGSDTIVKKGEKIATVHSYFGKNGTRVDHLHIGIHPNAKDPQKEYRVISSKQQRLLTEVRSVSMDEMERID